MKNINEIIDYINNNDDIRAVNEYKNDVDKYYLTKNGKIVFYIRWYQYEHLQGFDHDTWLVGENICQMVFNKKLEKRKDGRKGLYYGRYNNVC